VTVLSRAARALVVVAATAVVMAAVAAGSAAPVGLHPGESGRLRLSWSARPERIETCREVSAKELAELEEHMRQRVECDGHFATYTLQVRADDRVVATTVVRGAGLRHDRPIYLLREFDVPAGVRRIRVSFIRREPATTDAAREAHEADDADSGISTGRAEREMVERARRGRAAVPPRLVLDTSLTILPRGVTVVTLNQERRTLELVHAASQP
jgi:hypothetical protein